MAYTKRRSSHETKAALSNYVLPETMDDIEEFLKPQFPLKDQRRTIRQQDKDGEDEDLVEGRRIVMDGFGRWREVRPNNCNPSRRFEPINSTNLSNMKQVFGMQNTGPSRCDSDLNTPLVKSRYDKFKSHLDTKKMEQSRRNSDSSSVCNRIGMIMRSNVFPGIGNYQWNTTTARTFTEKPITPVEDRKVFFGLQTDEFGAWSAANVLNERMKKAWGEYMESLPKPKAMDQPPESIVHAKPKQPLAPKKPKTTKPKKNPPKTNTKQDNVVTGDHPFQEAKDPPTERQPPPPYVPDGDDADDNFWDFYDKPFNKPER